MGFPNYEDGSINLRFFDLARYANNWKNGDVSLGRCAWDFDNIVAQNLSLFAQKTHDKMQNLDRKATLVCSPFIILADDNALGGGGTTWTPSTYSMGESRVLVWEEKNDPKDEPSPFNFTKKVRLMMYEDTPDDVVPPTFTRIGGLIPGVSLPSFPTYNQIYYGSDVSFSDNKVYGVPQGATFDTTSLSFRINLFQEGFPDPIPVADTYRLRLRFVIIAGTKNTNNQPVYFVNQPVIYASAVSDTGLYNTNQTYTFVFNANSFGIGGWGFNSGQNTQIIKDATIKLYNLENKYLGFDIPAGSPNGVINDARYEINFGMECRFYKP